MDLKYLKKEILPQRKKEIAEGLNLGTRQPIYVVLDLDYNFIGGHDMEGWLSGEMLNHARKASESGYVDTALDCEDREFNEEPDGMDKPEEVTKIYTDRVVAFFLTRQGAEAYLEYQKHNLKEAYVYTFYSGYANHEMDAILCGG